MKIETPILFCTDPQCSCGTLPEAQDVSEVYGKFLGDISAAASLKSDVRTAAVALLVVSTAKALGISRESFLRSSGDLYDMTEIKRRRSLDPRLS